MVGHTLVCTAQVEPVSGGRRHRLGSAIDFDMAIECQFANTF